MWRIFKSGSMVVMIALLAACGSITAGQPATPAMQKAPTAAAIAEKPAWQQITLVNARSGKAFTLGDFAGKTVYVEPMATWCSNCKQQLTTVQQVQQKLGDDTHVFIALSVETDLKPADLASYAKNHAFDAVFAVATPEALQALVDRFGRTITNPPSTPHFVIYPDGTASELKTGFDDADALTALLAE